MDEKPYVWIVQIVPPPAEAPIHDIAKDKQSHGKLEPTYFAHGESLRSLAYWLIFLLVASMIGLYLSL